MEVSNVRGLVCRVSPLCALEVQIQCAQTQELGEQIALKIKIVKRG